MTCPNCGAHDHGTPSVPFLHGRCWNRALCATRRATKAGAR